MRERIRPDTAAVNINGPGGQSFSDPNQRLIDSPARLAHGTSSLQEREKIVLWRHPIRTLHYFSLELALTVGEYGRKLVAQRKLLVVLLLVTSMFLAVYHTGGRHQVGSTVV